MERQTTRVAATIAPALRPSGTNSPTHARATFTRRPRAAAAPAIAATVAIILVSALLFGVLGRFQRGGHGLTPGGQPGAAVTTPTGTAPTPTPGATGPAGTLHGLITDIAMMPSGDGWAVGSQLSNQGTNVLLRYHAGQWMAAPLPIAGVRLVGIAMDSASDGWAVGSRADASPVGILLHYANGRWVQAPETFPGVDLGGVSMDSATDGWAIGTDPNATFGGLVLHFDGARWRQVSIPGATFAGVMVRALAPDNVWVVGNVGKERSVILHYDGSAWVATPLPDHVGFIGEIAMLSADEGWAVGLNNVILRYHAGAWTVVATVPQGAQPLAIAMASGTDGWVAGFNNPSPAGVFLEHYDGHTWSLVAGPRQVGPTDIVALTVTTDGEVWAGGHAETSGGQVPILLRFANGRWRAVPIP